MDEASLDGADVARSRVKMETCKGGAAAGGRGEIEEQLREEAHDCFSSTSHE